MSTCPISLKDAVLPTAPLCLACSRFKECYNRPSLGHGSALSRARGRESERNCGGDKKGRMGGWTLDNPSPHKEKLTRNVQDVWKKTQVYWNHQTANLTDGYKYSPPWKTSWKNDSAPLNAYIVTIIPNKIPSEFFKLKRILKCTFKTKCQMAGTILKNKDKKCKNIKLE